MPADEKTDLAERIWKRALGIKLEGADAEIEEEDEDDEDLEAAPIPEGLTSTPTKAAWAKNRERA